MFVAADRLPVFVAADWLPVTRVCSMDLSNLPSTQSTARATNTGRPISASTVSEALATLLSSSCRLIWPEALTTAKRLSAGL